MRFENEFKSLYRALPIISGHYEIEVGTAAYPFLGGVLPHYYFDTADDAHNAAKMVEDVLALVDNYKDQVDDALDEIEDENTATKRYEIYYKADKGARKSRDDKHLYKKTITA